MLLYSTLTTPKNHWRTITGSLKHLNWFLYDYEPKKKTLNGAILHLNYRKEPEYLFIYFFL